MEGEVGRERKVGNRESRYQDFLIFPPVLVELMDEDFQYVTVIVTGGYDYSAHFDTMPPSSAALLLSLFSVPILKSPLPL